MSGGYWGRLLEVDLASGGSRAVEVPRETCSRFVGGSGLAAWCFFERGGWRHEALSPDNDLYIVAGPLVGTALPGSSRFAVAARSPLTGLFGEATCGGDCGPELRMTGFDGLIVRGAASSPVYLVIDDDRVELRDARPIWGRDTFATRIWMEEQAFRTGRRPKSLCIGPAGERLVRFAAVAHTEHDYAARTGMGAVMGGKRLKGIAVRGSRKVPIARPEAYKEHRRRLLRLLEESVVTQSLKELGTDANMDLGMMMGDIPIQNWSRGEDFALASALGGPTLKERYLTGSATCYACPTACKRVVEVNEGPWATQERRAGPEYETVAGFGALLANADLAAVVAANEWCNRYGLDTISASATIAFAYDCFAHGILSERDTEGLVLRWGDPGPAIGLLHLIARREGIGDLLADGSREAARRLGGAAEALAVEVKGLEVPFHDPRGSHGLGLAYAVSNRGACHKQHVVEGVEHGLAAFADVGFESDYVGQSSAGKAAMVKLAEDFGLPMNAMAFCEFDLWPQAGSDVARMLEVATGDPWDVAAIVACGERMWLLKRALNCLMGLKAADDRLPAKLLTPLEDGAAAGSVPDLHAMLAEYYALRGLDEGGRPTPAALERAGLSALVGPLDTALPRSDDDASVPV